jgi:hypothetical protein
MAAPKKAAVAKRGPGSDDDFVYESSVGEITVPSLSKAKAPNAWQIMEIESIENQRVKNARESLLFVQLAAGDDPDSLALIKQLDIVEFGEFLEAWGEHSGVQLGEYKAS